MPKQNKTITISNEVIHHYQAQTSITQLTDSHSGLVFRYWRDRRHGSFYCVIWLLGKRQWKKLGSFPKLSTTTAKKALRIAEQHLSLAAQQGKVAEVAVAPMKQVADVLDWYLVRVEQDKQLSVHSQKGIKSVINAHLLPLLGRVVITELHRQVLDEQLMWPLQQKLKPSTLRQIFQVLKRAFKRGVGAGILLDDPMANFVFKEFVSKKITAKIGRLSVVDLPHLYVLLEDAPTNVQTMILMMLLFGTRVGETRLACWRDFDRRANTWRIRAQETKTKRSLRLPLTDVAWQVLNLHRQRLVGPARRSDYLFAKSSDSKLSVSAPYASQQVSSLAQQEWSSHDLRKLARTSWLELGVDYIIGEFLLNHQLRAVDQAYIQTFADVKCAEALTTWHHYLMEHGLGAFLSRRPSADRVQLHRA